MSKGPATRRGLTLRDCYTGNAVSHSVFLRSVGAIVQADDPAEAREPERAAHGGRNVEEEVSSVGGVALVRENDFDPTSPKTQDEEGTPEEETERAPASGEREELPEVELDPNELALVFDGSKVLLTRTQFSIFAYLVENRGDWVATAELIRRVLGTHHRPDTSLVRVHVHAIRRRLGWRAAWLESDPQRARGYRWRGRTFACEAS